MTIESVNNRCKIVNVKILPDIPIPEKYKRGFQQAVETLASDANVPVALIMRLGRGTIEVFGANAHHQNPYQIGATDKLLSGLYCETVVKTGRMLIVPNADKDKIWRDNPDVERKMIAYMGLPIYWPGGEVFGTICLLNNMEHNFDNNELEFVQTVHDAIESDLAEIYNEYCTKHLHPPEADETTVAGRL